jgi:hypothetical protein
VGINNNRTVPWARLLVGEVIRPGQDVDPGIPRDLVIPKWVSLTGNSVNLTVQTKFVFLECKTARTMEAANSSPGLIDRLPATESWRVRYGELLFSQSESTAAISRGEAFSLPLIIKLRGYWKMVEETG